MVAKIMISFAKVKILSIRTVRFCRTQTYRATLKKLWKRLYAKIVYNKSRCAKTVYFFIYDRKTKMTVQARKNGPADKNACHLEYVRLQQFDPQTWSYRCCVLGKDTCGGAAQLNEQKLKLATARLSTTGSVSELGNGSLYFWKRHFTPTYSHNVAKASTRRGGTV